MDKYAKHKAGSQLGTQKAHNQFKIKGQIAKLQCSILLKSGGWWDLLPLNRTELSSVELCFSSSKLTQSQHPES